MILNKRSDHVFETCDVRIELSEFPFDAGEELHLGIEPIENIEYFGLMGNPEDNQTLSLKVGEAYLWIKGDYNLLPKLEEAIAKYKKGWNEYYQSLQGSVKNE